MNFIQVNVRCPSDFSDILIAELAELEFESFEENKGGFNAYIEEEKIDFEATKGIFERYASLAPIHYGLQKIEKQNWNQDWESNYPPIVIGDKILVKTPFHQISESFDVEIVIIPKMSFGTGHHATTSQMLTFLMKYPPLSQKVIDAGTGTGILAIMAEKMGAAEIIGFDNDPWCIENSLENFQLNGTQKCTAVLGSSISELGNQKAGTILANINKNVLLKEIPFYSRFLEPGGLLFLSGFYTEDIQDLEELANQMGLEKTDSTSKDNWACLVFRKAPDA